VPTTWDYADAALRQSQRTAGLLGLGVAASADRAPDHDGLRVGVEVDMGPCERPKLLGAGTGGQRHHDVGGQAGAARGGQQRYGISPEKVMQEIDHTGNSLGDTAGTIPGNTGADGRAAHGNKQPDQDDHGKDGGQPCRWAALAASAEASY